MKSLFDNPVKSATKVVSNYALSDYVMGFASKFQNGITYYVPDASNISLVVFDKDWNYQRHQIYNFTSAIFRLGGYLYTLLDTRLEKLDFNLNVIKGNSGMQFGFRFAYIPTGNCFYITYPLRIDIYDINFKFIESFSLNNTQYNPWDIKVFNNKVYVGTSNKEILIMENKNIVDVIPNVCINNFISSIYVDYAGYIAVNCMKDYRINLYDPNKVKLGSFISTHGCDSTFSGFDLSGRYVVICSKISASSNATSGIVIYQ